jgi:hypothetical protein
MRGSKQLLSSYCFSGKNYLERLLNRGEIPVAENIKIKDGNFKSFDH